MKENSSFVPIFGTQSAINNEAKISGQLIFSDEGKIFLDAEDGMRIPIADKSVTCVFVQSEAATQWVIEHNLDRFPTIIIFDDDGNELIGDIYYETENKLTITFSAACSGKAYLN